MVGAASKNALSPVVFLVLLGRSSCKCKALIEQIEQYLLSDDPEMSQLIFRFLIFWILFFIYLSYLFIHHTHLFLFIYLLFSAVRHPLSVVRIRRPFPYFTPRELSYLSSGKGSYVKSKKFKEQAQFLPRMYSIKCVQQVPGMSTRSRCYHRSHRKPAQWTDDFLY